MAAEALGTPAAGLSSRVVVVRSRESAACVACCVSSSCVFRLPLSRVEQRGRLHFDVRARADEKHGYDGQGLLVEQGRHGCAHPSKPRAWRQRITHPSPLQPFKKQK